VFETNSSSTHSLIFCTEDEYKKLKNNELLIDCWNDEFISKEEYDKEAEKIAKEYGVSKSEVLNNPHDYDMPRTLEDWYGYLEGEGYHYTSPSGDKIVAICKYGWDG